MPKTNAPNGLRQSKPLSAGRLPSQQRSRERVERILGTASDLIEAGGCDTLRMSDIAARAEISIGSLYQYFPDKSAIIRRLAERFNAAGRTCVAAELAQVRVAGELQAALRRVTDGYYAMFLAEPVMRDIWSGTQNDKALLALEAEDNRAHGKMLAETLMRLHPAADRKEINISAFLLMHLIAATVRLAITLPQQEARKLIETFKQTILETFRLPGRSKK